MKNLENLKKYSNFNLANVMGGNSYYYQPSGSVHKDEDLITVCSRSQRNMWDGVYDCEKGQFDWIQLRENC